jgi:hypothetical protein
MATSQPINAEAAGFLKIKTYALRKLRALTK